MSDAYVKSVRDALVKGFTELPVGDEVTTKAVTLGFDAGVAAHQVATLKERMTELPEGRLRETTTKLIQELEGLLQDCIEALKE